MCRKANHEDGISMKFRKHWLNGRLMQNWRGQGQKQAPQPMERHYSTAEHKQEIADARLHIKGLIFFPSQSENTMIDLS